MPEAEALARKMIAWPASGIKYSKLAITYGQDLPLKQAITLESWFSTLSASSGKTTEAPGKNFLARKRRMKGK
jgi:enoyl-CoA hydratase/carnithine racemase